MSAPSPTSAWAPLRFPVCRRLWLAQGEHARQHSGRLTGVDRAAEERVQALVGAPPRVRHLLAADLGGSTRRH